MGKIIMDLLVKNQSHEKSGFGSLVFRISSHEVIKWNTASNN